MQTNVGMVEEGLRVTFDKWGILEPTTVWECMAVNLAQILDGTSPVHTIDNPDFKVKDKTAVASINRQLLITLDRIEASLSGLGKDPDERIADKY